MNHNNEIICSVCGNTLVKYYDNVTRVVRTTGGKRKMIKIPRFRCEICGHIQRDLPDYIFPYKQYEKEVIEGVLEGYITSDTIGYENYPSETTMKRWRALKKHPPL